MKTRQLDKTEWESYFDRMTRKLLGGDCPELTRIEVLTADMGMQLETSREQLAGLTYDPKEDAFEFSFDSFVHRVFHPREIHVVEDDAGVLRDLRLLVEDVDLRLKKGRVEVMSLRKTGGYRALLESGS